MTKAFPREDPADDGEDRRHRLGGFLSLNNIIQGSETLLFNQSKRISGAPGNKKFRRLATVELKIHNYIP